VSGGEQQMLAIGRALMTNPKLLVLDEATEGLAPLIRAEIWACLAHLKAEGEAIVVIDKNVEALTRLADRHLVIEKGRVAWAGTSAELRADRRIKERYLHVGTSGGASPTSTQVGTRAQPGSGPAAAERHVRAGTSGMDLQKGRTKAMKMPPGITKAGEGFDHISWNILGQTYIPKQVSETSFSWHATFPPDTFVPPHIHPTQDEFIYMLEGQFELMLDGKTVVANPGDLVRMPMGLPHGIFNKSGRTVKCFFWVAPTRRLYDLFWAIHNMPEQTPAEVVALSAKHEVDFLPPPDESK
jgi:quercetin dioxygenase-like cupin family protein